MQARLPSPSTDAPDGSARRGARTVLQVGMLIVAWWSADRAAAALGLPFSGGVVGLLLTAGLLWSGILKPRSIALGAEWLLANMLLFFIPLVVSVVQFTELLKSDGYKLFVAIGIGFTCVLLATALTVEWVCRIKRGQRLHRARQLRARRAAGAGAS